MHKLFHHFGNLGVRCLALALASVLFVPGAVGWFLCAVVVLGTLVTVHVLDDFSDTVDEYAAKKRSKRDE